MKKSLIALSMLAAFAAQSAPAFAGCADLYKEAALKRDHVQDVGVALSMGALAIPGLFTIAPAGIVPTFAYTGVNMYVDAELSILKFGHQILPNKLEKISKILTQATPGSLGDANDISEFSASVTKSYRRAVAKEVRKGDFDDQPLTSEEIDLKTRKIIQEADSQNAFCPVIGKRKDGSEKHGLFTRVAIRDFVLAKILAEQGVELKNLSTILRELKDDTVDGVEKGWDKTKDAYSEVKESMKKLFRKKDRHAQESASDAQQKIVTAERDSTQVALPNVASQGVN